MFRRLAALKTAKQQQNNCAVGTSDIPVATFLIERDQTTQKGLRLPSKSDTASW